MNVRGMTYPEFKHMFQAGYIKNIDRELVEELMDMIDGDYITPNAQALMDMEEERNELQKEANRYLQDYNDAYSKLNELKQQLFKLTSRITDLSQISKEMVDKRIAMREY